MSQLPNKRQRGEDEVALSEGDFLLQQQLQVLLKADTDELAGAGRNDATILVELEKFNGRLEASLSAVKKARAAEETTRKEKERDIQNEMDKKAREEKTKQREGLVAGKHCFQCNVVRDELSPCVGYKHGGGVSGDGILSCDECMDKVMSFTCASCNSFMHQELGGSSCCDVNCHDDSYTCKSCEEVYCVDCVESGDNEGWTCECCDWYCKDCTDDNMATNECAQCSKKDDFVAIVRVLLICRSAKASAKNYFVTIVSIASGVETPHVFVANANTIARTAICAPVITPLPVIDSFFGVEI
eukprot:CAMPEP_0172308170 /NCGR_PEP_ID=MMETSP1058-20130122/8857_1 /TAXON_ID=83371 /ORGANISM="Detonula confervacea, Strain CCMP 353" /LENGTH=299 /DNA_ID=CAMNT_0013020531 /DNA_START=51 /DNA_END=951 /DNA_ORIENTATION=-